MEEQEQDKKKLFVGNLAWEVKSEDLNAHFGQIGEVTSADVITNRDDPSRSMGYGFVVMATEEEAQKAIDELNGKELKGRPIVVNVARPKAPRTDR